MRLHERGLLAMCRGRRRALLLGAPCGLLAMRRSDAPSAITIAIEITSALRGEVIAGAHGAGLAHVRGDDRRTDMGTHQRTALGIGRAGLDARRVVLRIAVRVKLDAEGVAELVRRDAYIQARQFHPAHTGEILGAIGDARLAHTHRARAALGHEPDGGAARADLDAIGIDARRFPARIRCAEHLLDLGGCRRQDDNLDRARLAGGEGEQGERGNPASHALGNGTRRPPWSARASS